MATSLTLIHTSDWHLGHELHTHSREDEHDAFLSWLLDQIEEVSADALLVTGDVYDVANPPITAMRRLFAFLNAATQRRPNLQIVILGGNHDSAGRIDLPAALLGDGRIRFVGAVPRQGGQPDIDALLVPLAGPDAAPGALLAAIPFCRPGDLGQYSLAELYTAVADRAVAAAAGLPVILTGHLHVAGGEISELSERRIVVGGEEAEAASLFDARAAYVALGHLHRPQTITAPMPVRYAGSPFPLSATERGYRHSVTVVDLVDGNAQWRELPIPRPAPFLAVPADGGAPLEEVLAELEALVIDPDTPVGKRPFLEVSVAVDGPDPHLHAQVLAAIAEKAVRLTRIRQVRVGDTPDASGALPNDDLEELLPTEVFAAAFAKAHAGSELPAGLARAFEELLVTVNSAETA
ncbi:MAG: exonuclease SbcCD subunit D [Sphingobium sp. 32-64-5]|nr:MAG: exonuclease SbcCD subunit D [Sphingobium sp. 32-64-5]